MSAKISLNSWIERLSGQNPYSFNKNIPKIMMMLANIATIKMTNTIQEMMMPPMKVLRTSEKTAISVMIATRSATITSEKDMIASILFAFTLFILLQIIEAIKKACFQASCYRLYRIFENCKLLAFSTARIYWRLVIPNIMNNGQVANPINHKWLT